MNADNFVTGYKYLLAMVKHEFKDWDEYNLEKVTLLDGILICKFSDKQLDGNCINFESGQSLEGYRRCVDRSVTFAQIEALKNMTFDVEKIFKQQGHNYEC